MKILFVAGFGPIVDNDKQSQDLYVSALGLSLKNFEGQPEDWPDSSGYLGTNDLDGVKHFALWPLPLVAQTCFDKDSWPPKRLSQNMSTAKPVLSMTCCDRVAHHALLSNKLCCLAGRDSSGGTSRLPSLPC
jgi:hypothetical protein